MRIDTFALDDGVQAVGQAMRRMEAAVWPVAGGSTAQEVVRLARPALQGSQHLAVPQLLWPTA